MCVPHPVVIFEAILQAFGETQLAARIEAGGAEGGDLKFAAQLLRYGLQGIRQRLPADNATPVAFILSITTINNARR